MPSYKQVIYLDNHATTQIDKRVLDAMMPFLTNVFAKANSTEQFKALMIGLEKIAVFGSIRFSIGKFNAIRKWILLFML